MDSIGRRVVLQWLETLPATQIPSSTSLVALAADIDMQFRQSVMLVSNVLGLLDSLTRHDQVARGDVFLDQIARYWKPSAQRFLDSLVE